MKSCRFHIDAKPISPDDYDKIRENSEDIWNFDDTNLVDDEFTASGTDNIGNGNVYGEAANEIAYAIRDLVGHAVVVNVHTDEGWKGQSETFSYHLK